MVSLALMLVLAQDPALTGDRTIVSKCEVSDDATYGHSKDNPIKVGGTPMFGPARQRRVLQALVGPAGQAVRFERRGALRGPSDDIIIDRYEVTYAGLAKPIEIFMDLYRWDPPKAPQGFLCAREIGLTPPDPSWKWPPDPSAAPAPAPVAPPRGPRPPPGGNPPSMPWNRAVALAAEMGLREELPPIPLDPYGSLKYGVAFDPFTRIALAARASEGRIPEPMTRSSFSVETLVVAFPFTCGSVTAKPTGITTLNNGRPVGQKNEPLRGDALKRELVGYAVPDDALGVVLRGSTLPPNGQLTIAYDRPPCAAKESSVTLTVTSQFTPPAAVSPAWPDGVPVPPGDGIVRVAVHALVDHQGATSEVRAVEGPEAFHRAAVEAVKASRYGAMIINGVPMRLPRPIAAFVRFQPPR